MAAILPVGDTCAPALAARPTRRGTVGVYGNVQLQRPNGAVTEYNNWELDGGDNLDNAKHTTPQRYPSPMPRQFQGSHSQLFTATVWPQAAPAPRSRDLILAPIISMRCVTVQRTRPTTLATIFADRVSYKTTTTVHIGPDSFLALQQGQTDRPSFSGLDGARSKVLWQQRNVPVPTAASAELLTMYPRQARFCVARAS